MEVQNSQPVVSTQPLPNSGNEIKRKPFLLVVFTVLLILTIGVGVYYLFSRSNTATTPGNTVVEKVRIGNIGEYTIFNLIADEMGYFQENGLDAEIKEYSSGPAAMEALLAGEVDINIAADFVGVRNIFAHPEIRILAQVNHHRVFQLVGRKDLGVNDPKDLSGKKIGVTKNSVGEFYLGNFLAFNNLDLEDVTMVDLTPASMSSQLAAGEIDAVVVFEPHIYNMKKDIPYELSAWDVQGDQNTSALVYTTTKYLEEHPDIIERYLQSLVEAEEYFVANQEEVKKLLAVKMKYDKEYIDYSWPKFTHGVRLHQELLLSMEAKAEWVIENKLTDKTSVPNYLEFIYFDGLEKVKPDEVTIVY
jgi:NitT/TauT family transport system substrate-binding protein